MLFQLLEFIEKHIEGTDLEGDWLDAVVVALNFLKVTSITQQIMSYAKFCKLMIKGGDGGEQVPQQKDRTSVGSRLRGQQGQAGGDRQGYAGERGQLYSAQ